MKTSCEATQEVVKRYPTIVSFHKIGLHVTILCLFSQVLLLVALFLVTTVHLAMRFRDPCSWFHWMEDKRLSSLLFNWYKPAQMALDAWFITALVVSFTAIFLAHFLQFNIFLFSTMPNIINPVMRYYRLQVLYRTVYISFSRIQFGSRAEEFGID